MSSTTVFERRLPPDHSLIAPLRRDLASKLSRCAAPSLVVDAVLVVSELATNAITAARTSPDHVVVRVEVPDDDAVVVEVEDHGPGFASDPLTRRVKPEEEHGRGLRIVEAVADDVRVERFDERTRVRALLRRHEAFELARDFQ